MNIPTINLTATGQNINRKRLEAGIAVYKWIHGQNLPTIDNIIILASLLETTVDDIFSY